MSIDILQEKIREYKNPCMVGLDPTEDLIPLHILNQAYETLGESPEGLAEAYVTFCKELLDTLKDIVPAVKVQNVCFEVLGAAGVRAMQNVCEYAKSLGYYVVLDSMRCEAPHIASIYANHLFGEMSIGKKTYEFAPCDAATLNGYLGSESVQPYLPYCKTKNKSLFVMLRSSNKSGREIQDLLTGDRFVHTAMADLINRWSKNLIGKYGYSQIGAVLGAYDSNTLEMMRKRYDRIFFMIVGYGAQGGTAKPVSAAFDQLGRGAIVSASRSIIGAWKQEDSDGSDYCELAKAAALKMKKDITKYVKII